MVKNPNPSQPDSDDLFDVVVVVRSYAGSHLFSYYPKAGVIEVKRNKIWSQITLQELVDRGLLAVEKKSEERLQVKRSKSRSVKGIPIELPLQGASVDE